MAAELKDSVPDLDGEKWREAYDTICDYYRLALFNSLYCGKRLASTSVCNLALEISIAILAAIVATMTALKDPITVPWWLMFSIAAAAAVLSGIKPILKLGDSAAKYAAQHGSYRDLYLAYQDLVAFIRIEGRVTAVAWREHETLTKRYRALAVSSDPNPSVRYREALKREVEMQIPVANLRIA